MKFWRLQEDERKRVDWVINWIFRMTQKYGATVLDKNGKTWDWGQALCRECYGEDWNDNPNLPDTPSWEDVSKAKRCEEKLWDWILEECGVCHGEGSTTDHHDPCSECGGSGYYK